MIIWLFIAIFSCAMQTAADEDDRFSVFLSETGDFHIVKRDLSLKSVQFAAGELAFGGFNDLINTTGWSLLEVHTNPATDDFLAAQAAGYLEGSLTAERMELHAINIGISNFSASPALQRYFDDNAQFMESSISAALLLPPGTPERVYWRQVALVLNQLNGLYDGYQAARQGRGVLTHSQVRLLNQYWELSDLIGAYGGEYIGLFNPSEHCSALIRLLDDNSDVFVSHTTWGALNLMTRVYKLYDLPFRVDDETVERIAGFRVSFPAYPASLFSADDFYELSSGLVVMETTIDFENSALNAFIVPQSVPEWIRTIVANRLASTTSEWTEAYSKLQSGTYNNQNIVFDYKLFTPGQPVVNGTLVICEQIPGYIVNHDMSQMLQEQGYFASYNRIYDAFLSNVSGFDEMERLYGYYYNWTETPRAQIFRRDYASVTDLASMQRLMRYNNFTTDPLSLQLPFCQYRGWHNCTPAYDAHLAIAARDDLNPLDGVYAFYDISAINEAAIDCKISSYSTYDPVHLFSWAISGPTNDPLPVFRFSTCPYNNTPHFGLPDAWDFPWITISWSD